MAGGTDPAIWSLLMDNLDKLCISTALDVCKRDGRSPGHVAGISRAYFATQHRSTDFRGHAWMLSAGASMGLIC